MRLQISDLTYAYGDKKAIDQVSLCVNKGEFIGLIGPNGSGKSTVLKNVYRGLKPDGGRILLDGEDLLKMSFKKSARKMAVVGQENEIPFDFLVEEIVAMGRSPHKGIFDVDNAEDKAMVHHALEHLGMEHMAKRNYLHLSGGEKQRVAVARALVNHPDVIMADEPSGSLDSQNKEDLHKLFFDLRDKYGQTFVIVTHDESLATLTDRTIHMKDGIIIDDKYRTK